MRVPRRSAATPSPAMGSPLVVSGGQPLGHPPVHVDTLGSSRVNKYRVRPLPSVRIAPSSEWSDTWMATGVTVGAGVTGEVSVRIGVASSRMISVGLGEGMGVGVGVAVGAAQAIVSSKAPVTTAKGLNVIFLIPL